MKTKAFLVVVTMMSSVSAFACANAVIMNLGL